MQGVGFNSTKATFQASNKANQGCKEGVCGAQIDIDVSNIAVLHVSALASHQQALVKHTKLVLTTH